MYLIHVLSIIAKSATFFFSRKQVLSTRQEAAKDGIVVPTTLADYCVSAKPSTSDSVTDFDFYDDDYVEDDDDDDDDDDCCYNNEEEDSGNSDS